MVKPKACRSLLHFLIHAALTLTFPITHAQAQIIIDPDTIVFAPRQIHTTSEEKSFTIYYMWAFPHADISGSDHIVIFARASVYVDPIGFDLINVSANPVHNNDVTPRIYPNPAHDTVIITDPGSTVSLIDLTGKIIKTFQTTHDHHQLGISGLSPGVYLMQIVGPKSSKIEKFFVN